MSKLNYSAKNGTKPMIAHLNRGTARIYAFPTIGRAGRIAAVELARVPVNAEALRFAPTDFGSGWYHDAAIESAAGKADKGN